MNKLGKSKLWKFIATSMRETWTFWVLIKKEVLTNSCQSRLQSDKFGYLLKPVYVCVTLLVMERCCCVLTSVLTIVSILISSNL